MRGDGWNRNCVIEFVCLSRLSLSESWLRLSRSGIRSGLTARPRWSRRGWKSGTVLCVQYFARKQHFLLSGFWKYQGQKGDSTADFPRDSAPSFSLARQLGNLLHERTVPTGSQTFSCSTPAITRSLPIPPGHWFHREVFIPPGPKVPVDRPPAARLRKKKKEN